MQTRLRSKVTLLFMMLGLLLAVPTVAFAAQTRNVAANDADGTATGINVPAGCSVSITASGTVDLHTGETSPAGTETGSPGYDAVTANGVPYTDSATYDPGPDPGTFVPDASVGNVVDNDLKVGALIGRIGTSGDWFMVGTSRTISVPNSGQLYLIVNDSFFGNNSGSFTAVISVNCPDTLRPRVSSTVPTNGATGLGPFASAKANFSEDMKASTINGQTFKLFKQGSTTKVGATVSYNATMDRAILNPTNGLQRGATYKAVVTTFATDKAGNRLDQNRSLPGLQQKAWTFKISN